MKLLGRRRIVRFWAYAAAFALGLWVSFRVSQERKRNDAFNQI